MAPSNPPISPHTRQSSQTTEIYIVTNAQRTTATAYQSDPRSATYAPRMRPIPLPLTEELDNTHSYPSNSLLTPPPSPENFTTRSYRQSGQYILLLSPTFSSE